jgi:uncharacterized membrane protein
MNEAAEFRNCPKCGKEIKADATLCGYCWAKLSPMTSTGTIDSSGAEPRQASAIVSIDSADALFTSPHARGVARRYRDAYTVANSVVEHGQAVKIIAVVVGIILALLVALSAVFAGAAAPNIGNRTVGFIAFLVFGFSLASFIAAVIYAQGVRIAAEGQHLLAAIDLAVNTSQFITNPERAHIMGL